MVFQTMVTASAQNTEGILASSPSWSLIFLQGLHFVANICSQAFLEIDRAKQLSDTIGYCCMHSAVAHAMASDTNAMVSGVLPSCYMCSSARDLCCVSFSAFNTATWQKFLSV